MIKYFQYESIDYKLIFIPMEKPNEFKNIFLKFNGDDSILLFLYFGQYYIIHYPNNLENNYEFIEYFLQLKAEQAKIDCKDSITFGDSDTLRQELIANVIKNLKITFTDKLNLKFKIYGIFQILFMKIYINIEEYTYTERLNLFNKINQLLNLTEKKEDSDRNPRGYNKLCKNEFLNNGILTIEMRYLLEQ